MPLCMYILSLVFTYLYVFISMAWHRTAVAPALTHWSCCGLAFGHECSACMIWCVGACVFYLLCLHVLLYPVCLSVRLSVCPSVCPLTFLVRPVPSTVQNGFFPYLVQMISSMRGCVACDNPWPWPISSRSFGLDLENCVRSVASTVLDGFFLYLAQMIIIIRGCVMNYVLFRFCKFEFMANFLNFSALTLKTKIYSSRWILSIFSTNDH